MLSRVKGGAVWDLGNAAPACQELACEAKLTAHAEQCCLCMCDRNCIKVLGKLGMHQVRTLTYVQHHV